MAKPNRKPAKPMVDHNVIRHRQMFYDLRRRGVPLIEASAFANRIAAGDDVTDDEIAEVAVAPAALGGRSRSEQLKLRRQQDRQKLRRKTPVGPPPSEEEFRKPVGALAEATPAPGRARAPARAEKRMGGDPNAVATPRAAPAPPKKASATRKPASGPVIPEDWNTLPWPGLRDLAKSIAGTNILSRAEANVVIAGEVQRRGVDR